MKFLSTLFSRFVKNEKKILGRWTIEQCDKKTNHKVDLSNEDHCGPCGQYSNLPTRFSPVVVVPTPDKLKISVDSNRNLPIFPPPAL